MRQTKTNNRNAYKGNKSIHHSTKSQKSVYATKIALLCIMSILIPLYTLPLLIAITRWFSQPLGPFLALSISEALFVFMSTIFEAECVAMLIIALRREKPEKSFRVIFYISLVLVLVLLSIFLAVGWTAQTNR